MVMMAMQSDQCCYYCGDGCAGSELDDDTASASDRSYGFSEYGDGDDDDGCNDEAGSVACIYTQLVCVVAAAVPGESG